MTSIRRKNEADVMGWRKKKHRQEKTADYGRQFLLLKHCILLYSFVDLVKRTYQPHLRISYLHRKVTSGAQQQLAQSRSVSSNRLLRIVMLFIIARILDCVFYSVPSEISEHYRSPTPSIIRFSVFQGIW